MRASSRATIARRAPWTPSDLPDAGGDLPDADRPAGRSEDVPDAGGDVLDAERPAGRRRGRAGRGRDVPDAGGIERPVRGDRAA